MELDDLIALVARTDGNFYIERTCSRCQEHYYVHALQNTTWRDICGINECGVCAGECSAAQLSFHNDFVRSWSPTDYATTTTCFNPRVITPVTPDESEGRR